MLASNSGHRRFRFASMRLGAGAAPFSLLLLPKCPLCLVPLLAFLGITIPAPASLWVMAGIVIAAWLVILLVGTRRHPVMRAIACVAAAASFMAIGVHSRLLLWAGVAAMAAAAIALSRTCSYRTAGTRECLTHQSNEA